MTDRTIGMDAADILVQVIAHSRVDMGVILAALGDCRTPLLVVLVVLLCAGPSQICWVDTRCMVRGVTMSVGGSAFGSMPEAVIEPSSSRWVLRPDICWVRTSCRLTWMS